MMNAPADHARGARGSAARARVAVGHPARARRDDRDPRGGRRGRGLGPAAAPQGRRRVRDPRPADREDRPVTRHAGVDAGAATRAARPPRARRGRRARERDALFRRGAVPDPSGPRSGARRSSPTSGPAAPTPSGTRDRAVRRRPAPTAACCSSRRSSPPPRRARRRAAARARDGDRQRPPVRRDPAAGVDAHDDRPGRRDRATLAAPRRVGGYVPGGLRAVPVVAGDDRGPGAGRGRRRRSSSRRRPDRDGDVDPVLLGAAGLLGIDALLVAGGAQAIGALAFGLPDAGLRAGRLDRRARERVGDRRQARARRRGRHRPAGRTVGGPRPRRRDGRPVDGRRRPDHAGRARARLPRPPRDARRGVRRRASRPTFGRRLATALAARHPRARARRPRPDRPRRRPRRRRSPSSTATRPEHLSVDVADARGRGRPRSATPGSIFVGPLGARVGRRLRVGRQPRPADRRARARLRAAGGRDVRQVHPGPADHARRAWRRSGPTIRALAEAEGLLAHRDAVEARFDDPAATRAPADEPEPVHRLARRPIPPLQLGGDRRGRRRALRRPDRTDRCGSTSTPRPRRPRSLAGLLAAGRFETPLSEYPPGDYRQLVEAAADAYGVADRRARRRARAPTRSSTCARRRSCPPGEAAVVPVPTYAMYRVHAEQRGARVDRRPAPGPRTTAGRWTVPAVRAGGSRRRRSSGSATPTTRPGRPSPTARSSACSTGSRPTPTPTAAPRRPSSSTRPTASSAATSVIGLRDAVSEPGRGPDGLARPTRSRASGSGSRSAPRRRSRRDRPVPAAGLDQHRVRDRGHRGASATRRRMRANVERVVDASARGLAAGLEAAGFGARSRRSRTSCCSTSSRRSARRRPRSR